MHGWHEALNEKSVKTSISKTESMFGFPDNHRISSRLHVFFGPTNCPPPLCGRTRWLVHRCTKHNQQPHRPTAMCFFFRSQMKPIRERWKRRDGQPTAANVASPDGEVVEVGRMSWPLEGFKRYQQHKNIPDLLMAEIQLITWDGAETL